MEEWTIYFRDHKSVEILDFYISSIIPIPSDYIEIENSVYKEDFDLYTVVERKLNYKNKTKQ